MRTAALGEKTWQGWHLSEECICCCLAGSEPGSTDCSPTATDGWRKPLRTPRTRKLCGFRIGSWADSRRETDWMWDKQYSIQFSPRTSHNYNNQPNIFLKEVSLGYLGKPAICEDQNCRDLDYVLKWKIFENNCLIFECLPLLFMIGDYGNTTKPW